MLPQGFLHDISTSALRLSEAQVVVRRHVERSCVFSGEVVCLVIVFCATVDYGDRPPSDTCHRLREAVVDAQLEAAGIE